MTDKTLNKIRPWLWGLAATLLVFEIFRCTKDAMDMARQGLYWHAGYWAPCSLPLYLLLEAIYYSGNGSQEYPYKVTCVDDEYTFMSQGLDLPRPTNQSLTKDGHDMFKLPAHSSTLYTGQEIHFDATRILELEQNLFNPN